MKKVTLITGDGIGPEIVKSVKAVFKASGVKIKWEEVSAGLSAMKKYGTPLPQHVLDSIRKNKVALKAPLTTPIGKGIRSVNVQLRKELDLYANVRPIISIDGVESKFKDIDLCIVRENTEGLYSGIEHYIGEDAAETIKITTRKASERIAKFALLLTCQRNREKIRMTIVHKANIMKFTDGLFLESALKMAKNYDAVNVDERIIDNMCAQLVVRPETFDVILAPNFYGDILSDLCAGLIGGLGVAPGANIGDGCAVYEAIHGTAPDIAGKNIANPTSLLLSAAWMLRDSSIKDYVNSHRIREAILETIKKGKNLTGDLGGDASTTKFTKEIIRNLK